MSLEEDFEVPKVHIRPNVSLCLPFANKDISS